MILSSEFIKELRGAIDDGGYLEILPDNYTIESAKEAGLEDWVIKALNSQEILLLGKKYFDFCFVSINNGQMRSPLFLANLIRCFLVDCCLALNNRIDVLGGFKSVVNLENNNNMRLLYFLEARELINKAGEGDEFLQKWETLFQNINWIGYDPREFIKGVFFDFDMIDYDDFLIEKPIENYQEFEAETRHIKEYVSGREFL